MGGRDWTLTRHAQRRCTEMGVSEGEAVQVALDPEVDYPADYSGGRGCRTAQRGKLAVGYNPDERVIITVLWNVGPLGGIVYDRADECPWGEDAPSEPEQQEAPAPAVRVRPMERSRRRRLAASYADDDALERALRGRCSDCFRKHETVAAALACDEELGHFDEVKEPANA